MTTTTRRSTRRLLPHTVARGGVVASARRDKHHKSHSSSTSSTACRILAAVGLLPLVVVQLLSSWRLMQVHVYVPTATTIPPKITSTSTNDAAVAGHNNHIISTSDTNDNEVLLRRRVPCNDESLLTQTKTTMDNAPQHSPDDRAVQRAASVFSTGSKPKRTIDSDDNDDDSNNNTTAAATILNDMYLHMAKEYVVNPARNRSYHEQNPYVSFLNNGHVANTRDSHRLSLFDFCRRHAYRLYVDLDSDNHYFSNVAMVQHPVDSNVLVFGFRITRHWNNPDLSYLMLCTGVPTTTTITRTSTKATNTLANFVCQDAGIGTGDVPKQCHAQYFLNPQVRNAYTNRTSAGALGPEDARFFFLPQDDKLYATFGMLGCHVDTKYDADSPTYSTYLASWKLQALDNDNGDPDSSSTTKFSWRLHGRPKVLDLRSAARKNGESSSSSLGDAYPAVTKSTIYLPEAQVQQQQPSLSKTKGQPTPDMRFVVGYTKDNLQAIVYQIRSKTLLQATTTDEQKRRSRYTIYPVTAGVDVFDADSRFWSSTNFVTISPDQSSSSSSSSSSRPLLTIGHQTQVDYESSFVNKTYHHFWNLVCPFEPYNVLATSPLFHLPQFQHGASYTTGLLIEGDYLYITWVEQERVQFLSRYAVLDVWEALLPSLRDRRATSRSRCSTMHQHVLLLLQHQRLAPNNKETLKS